jgi:hypothetical protein
VASFSAAVAALKTAADEAGLFAVAGAADFGAEAGFGLSGAFVAATATLEGGGFTETDEMGIGHELILCRAKPRTSWISADSPET